MSTDLPMSPDLIREYKYAAPGITSVYEIDILTEKSSELKFFAKQNEENQLKETQDGITFLKKGDTTEELIIKETLSYSVFSKPSSVSGSNANRAETYSSQYVWIFVLCAIGGFILAMWNNKRKRKRLKNNVHNN